MHVAADVVASPFRIREIQCRNPGPKNDFPEGFCASYMSHQENTGMGLPVTSKCLQITSDYVTNVCCHILSTWMCINHSYITHTHLYIYILILKYTDITQNTYIES
jgi:hypothetical protein